MTPSGWHDDTRSRDAGHDEMQIGIYLWLKRQSATTMSVTSRDGATKDYVRVSVGIETPFVQNGKIICFADICETFVHETPSAAYPHQPDRDTYFRVLEVKPKIWSVGGILRQCESMELAIKTWSPHHGYYRRHQVWVLPVCMADDPRLPLLLRVVDRVAVWDGENLRYRVGSAE